MFGNKTKKKVTETKKPAAPMVQKPAAKVETKPAEPVATPINVIRKGTVIEGNVKTDGDLHIEGAVNGDVTTNKNLIVGPSAIVKGNIAAENAEIAGTVEGTVNATGLLSIKATCKITGDVVTKDLNVESGSTFNGRFQVGTSGIGGSDDIFDDAAGAPVKPKLK